MNKLVKSTIENHVLTGKLIDIESSQLIAKVKFDNQNQSSDYSEIIEKYQKAIQSLSKKNLLNLANQISIELTESAYSQLDSQPNDEDYKNLKDDLILKYIFFYKEDGIVAVFHSDTEYPNMNIYCQIDDNANLIDISVG